MGDFRKHTAGDELEEEEAIDASAHEEECPHEQEGDGADDHAQDLLAADQLHGRCLRLLYLGKQIAKNGADAFARYRELSVTLNNILESLVEPRNGEIRDAERRRRGRPRRAGNSHPAQDQFSCPLCTNIHDIHRCSMYEIFPEQKTQSVGTLRGNIYCKLCEYGGHRKKGLPSLGCISSQNDRVRPHSENQTPNCLKLSDSHIVSVDDMIFNE
jgi:hypothetical protein